VKGKGGRGGGQGRTGQEEQGLEFGKMTVEAKRQKDDIVWVEEC
jgi:hypothetical protein